MRRASAFSGCSFGGNFAGGTSHPVAEGGKTPVSPCKPLCAIFLRKPSVYSISPVKSNVGRLCKKLKSGWGIKFMAAALPDFSLLLVLRVHREPGNVCVIKVWRNKRNFTDSTKLRCGRGKAPCFGVWAAVCDLSPKAERVLTFAHESERGPFVREVEKRLGTAL